MFSVVYLEGPDARVTGTWDWPSKIAGNWDYFHKISWDFGIGQYSQIFGWDWKNPSNWELGFGLKINWELGSGTPHHDPHFGVVSNKVIFCSF